MEKECRLKSVGDLGAGGLRHRQGEAGGEPLLADHSPLLLPLDRALDV